jgi:hypothetical protein
MASLCHITVVTIRPVHVCGQFSYPSVSHPPQHGRASTQLVFQHSQFVPSMDIISRKQVIPTPAHLDDIHVTAWPIAGITAWRYMHPIITSLSIVLGSQASNEDGARQSNNMFVLNVASAVFWPQDTQMGPARASVCVIFPLSWLHDLSMRQRDSEG